MLHGTEECQLHASTYRFQHDVVIHMHRDMQVARHSLYPQPAVNQAALLILECLIDGIHLLHACMTPGLGLHGV